MNFRVWLYLSALIMMNACSNSGENNIKNISYLALGDSYTIGESVGEDQRYPVLFRDTLLNLGYAMDMPQIIAKTGWTSAELLAALDDATLELPYDLVSLLIGVNNQYRGLDINIYEEEFQILLDRSIAYAAGIPGHVIVLSIPDWGVTPFASGRDREQIKQEIDLYNAINKELANESGVQYIDVTGISRRAASDTSLIAVDGLHPSGLMYMEWSKLMMKEAMIIFKE